MLTLRFVLFTLALFFLADLAAAKKKDLKKKDQDIWSGPLEVDPNTYPTPPPRQKRADRNPSKFLSGPLPFDDGAPFPIARSDRSSSKGSNDEEKAKKNKKNKIERGKKKKGSKKNGKKGKKPE
uniref:Putative secreted protein n=1 Tax=Amblyomma triste TaxID=251400 RepID=A0A023G3W5_AMBTT